MRFPMMLLCFVLCAGLGVSATINVPADYATIQGAINASSHGDLVLVGPNTYYENINFMGKNITLKSVAGPYYTFIDGNQEGSVVAFNTGEDETCILDGFTIANGTNSGVYCYFCRPKIQNNVIEDNTAIQGGGIQLQNASPEIMNNLIQNNSALISGGGIYCFYSQSKIYGNMIQDNQADDWGGGLEQVSSDSEISNNTIIRNSASHGGGLSFFYSKSSLVSNMVCDNSGDFGAGIYATYSTIDRFSNLTLCNNTATGAGGGIMLKHDTSFFISNTILWGNTSGPLTGPQLHLEYNSHVSIKHSDVQGGEAQVRKKFGSTVNWDAATMIDSNPFFVDELHHDYHLTHPSPCRDAGIYLLAHATSTDFEGDPWPKPIEGDIDMGADEFHRHFYVTGNNTYGGTLELKMVGYPGDTPVGMFVSLGIYDPPIPWEYGEWYLDFSTLFGPLMFPPIPGTGLWVILGDLPPAPTMPYTLYFHAFIKDGMSNLFKLDVHN